MDAAFFLARGRIAALRQGGAIPEKESLPGERMPVKYGILARQVYRFGVSARVSTALSHEGFYPRDRAFRGGKNFSTKPVDNTPRVVDMLQDCCAYFSTLASCPMNVQRL